MTNASIEFFDANAVIGRAAAPVFGSWLSRDQLLLDMDHFGISETLVAHVFSQELDSSDGNEAAIAAAAGDARLHAQATIFPSFGRGAPERTDRELDTLVAAGCAAVRVHPNPTHHIMDEDVYARQYELTTAMVSPLLAGLEARRLPLFVELAQTNWREIDEASRAFPNLSIVAINVSYTHKRAMFAMFEAHSNFFAETSCLHAYRCLEEVCDLFGSQRLVFGTRSPVYNPLPAVAHVLYADIPDGDKAAIASGNLRRLINRSGERLGVGSDPA